MKLSLKIFCVLLCAIFALPGPIAKAEAGRVSMEMHNANIVDAIKLLANSANLNIVIPQTLEGEVTVKLQNVSWENALSSILRTKGYSYQSYGDVVLIDSTEQLNTSLTTKVFQLQYLDATDMEPFIKNILSPQGKVNSLLESRRAGFAIGSGVGKGGSEEESNVAQKSRTLIITDTPEIVAIAEETIKQLDVEPVQIAIFVQVVELVLSRGQDIGIKWNLEVSGTGAAQPTTFPFPADAVGGPFLPEGAAFPTDGGTFTFGTLDASKLQATLKLLETTGDLNVLSNPKITTLNNLQASILIGQKFPITTESIDAETGLRTISLDHYEDIGIQLVVIPKVVSTDAVSMIIHPSVSTLGALIENRFPIIQTREADTQVMVKNNNTIVIGGLMQDQDTENITKVPVLGDIPILKYLFRHKQNSTQKVELVLFVTPHIVNGPAEGLYRDVVIQEAMQQITDKVDKKLGFKKKYVDPITPAAEPKSTAPRSKFQRRERR